MQTGASSLVAVVSMVRKVEVDGERGGDDCKLAGQVTTLPRSDREIVFPFSLSSSWLRDKMRMNGIVRNCKSVGRLKVVVVARDGSLGLSAYK